MTTPVADFNVRSIGEHNRLAALAREINETFLVADEAAKDHRVTIGKLLKEAKLLVRHGRWQIWLKENFPDRSPRDCQRCMDLAAQPDPAAAREVEKAAAREGMKRTRAKATNVSRKSDTHPAPPSEVWEENVADLPLGTPAKPPEQQPAIPPPAERPVGPNVSRVVTRDIVVNWFRQLSIAKQLALLTELGCIHATGKKLDVSVESAAASTVTPPLPPKPKPEATSSATPQCQSPNGCRYGSCSSRGICLFSPKDSTTAIRPDGRAAA